MHERGACEVEKAAASGESSATTDSLKAALEEVKKQKALAVAAQVSGDCTDSTNLPAPHGNSGAIDGFSAVREIP